MGKASRVYVAFLLCLTAQGFQQGNKQQTDVDAIYSLMLLHPETSHGPDNNSIYLIRDNTVPGTPQEPCVRPPDSEAARWAEVMADFAQRQNIPRKLEPTFHISKPFQLLSTAECDAFRRAKGRLSPPLPSAPPVTEERFQKATDLFSLTDVYFDRNHTLALTAISTWCGSLCGRYAWKVFEKGKDGKWEARDWITCTAMS